MNPTSGSLTAFWLLRRIYFKQPVLRTNGWSRHASIPTPCGNLLHLGLVFLAPWFTPFCFHAPYRVTLVNFRSLIFGLTPTGWRRTRTLTGKYKSHGPRTKLGGCAITANYVRHRVLAQFNHVICISLSLLCFTYKLHDDTPNRGTKRTYTKMNTRSNNFNSSNMYGKGKVHQR